MVEYKGQGVTFRNKEYKLTCVQVSIMIVDTVTDEEITAFPNVSLLPTQSLFKIFSKCLLLTSDATQSVNSSGLMLSFQAYTLDSNAITGPLISRTAQNYSK